MDDPRLRAGLLNLSLEHSREDIFRAFLEGVALNTRWMLEPFARLLGRDVGTITAVGGGAIRDIVTRRVPTVLGGNTLYATCAIVASVVLVTCTENGYPTTGLVASTITGAGLCLVARWRGWILPEADAWSARRVVARATGLDTARRRKIAWALHSRASRPTGRARRRTPGSSRTHGGTHDQDDRSAGDGPV